VGSLQLSARRGPCVEALPRALLIAVVACSALQARGAAQLAPARDAGAAPVEPPPLPPLGDANERAAALFDAIVRDDPRAASTFFLPRDAFRLIKAAANPNAVYDGLLRAYERDIHALHGSLPGLAQARFVRVELSHRRSWVLPGEEANRLPYWAQRHNALVYRVGDAERRIELRVLIAWQGRWYATHLSEFRHPHPH
jgi:hypothetical protein